MKLVKEIITITYEDDIKIRETVKQFHYNTEEEKESHSRIMIGLGCSDSGQVMQNIGTITNPNHVWFGSYYKAENL